MTRDAFRYVGLFLPGLIPTMAILLGCICNCDKDGNPPPTTEKVYVTTSEPDGSYEENMIYSGASITFHIYARENVSYYELDNISLAFEVSSPDGAVINGIRAEANTPMQVINPAITIADVEGSEAKIVQLTCSPTDGATMENGYDGEIMSIEVGAFDFSDRGKSMCLKQAPLDDGSPWNWHALDNISEASTWIEEGEPDWAEDACYEIGRPRYPLNVSIDAIEKEGDLYEIQTGDVATFAIRLYNNTDYNIPGLTVSFQVYEDGFERYDASEEEDVMNWTTTSLEATDDFKALFDTWQDLPGEGSATIITGDRADTVGISPSNWLDPTGGMPVDYDEVALYLTIGPIDEQFVGRTICVDSSFFQPSLKWLWSFSPTDPEDNLEPTWHDAPLCFEVVAVK